MDYDAELQMLNEALRRAYGIERHDQVLDIGCGAGQTTREAARMAAEGGALGVDVSADAIDRARELARVEGVRNATFVHADAQAHPFPSERFDVAISRFGTMFFPDPVVAFSNIGRALRSAGRLVMMVWQGHEKNEWSQAIEEALSGSKDAAASEALDPFSFADPAKVKEILERAAFTDVSVTDVQRPIYYGRDVAAALEWVHGFHVHEGDADASEHCIGRRGAQALREMLESRAGRDGVWFDSRAWIVRARRR